MFRRHPALALQLDGGGTFPPHRPARVAWVGMTPAPGLAELRAEVDEACRQELALAPERRPFRPHLTLARCRRPWPVGAARRWRRALEGTIGPAFTITEGVLMESRLRPQGAVYRPVARLPLAGAEQEVGR